MFLSRREAVTSVALSIAGHIAYYWGASKKFIPVVLLLLVAFYIAFSLGRAAA